MSFVSQKQAVIEWSDRERQVLDLIAQHKTNGEIAEALGLSFYTARHVSEILSKLGVDSRDEAARYWRTERCWRGRLHRVARAFAPVVAAKWAAGLAAAGVGVAGVAAGLAIAVNGGAAAPGTSNTAVAPGACDGLAAQCTFARELAGDLEGGDGVAILAMSKELRITCPDIATTAVFGARDLCLGAQPHLVDDGYVAGDEMGPRLVTGMSLATPRPADVPGVSDQYGNGALRLASIGCPEPGVSYGCDQRFAVAFTWIAAPGDTQPGLRAVRIYVVDQASNGSYVISSQGDYRVTTVLDPALHGGPIEMPFGHDLPMTFQPVNLQS